MPITFSIIIPTAKITSFLTKKTLPAIFSQSEKSFELIIVTNQNNFPKIGKQVKVIKTKIKNPGKMRNLAAQNSHGSILVFIDDDVYPSKNWLKQIRAKINSPKITAVCGPGVTPPKSTFSQSLSGWFWASPLGSANYLYRCFPQSKRFVDDFPTFNLAVKSPDFFQIKGFDCHYWPGEDTKLCHDLAYNLHKKILYHPKILVFHQRRSILKHHLAQLNRYAIHRGFYTHYLPKTSKRISYFIPSIFLLILLVFISQNYFKNFPYFSSFILPIVSFILIFYLLLSILNSIWIFQKSKIFLISFLSIPIIFISHLSYGSCFLYGLFQKKLKF